MDESDLKIFRSVAAQYELADQELRAQFERMEAIEPSAEKEAAMLAALSQVHASRNEALTAERLHMGALEVTHAIDRFTTATNESGGKMEDLTRATVWAAWLLLGFTVVQVIIAAIGLLAPTQVVVLTAPR